MPARVATYQRLLAALAATLVATQLVVWTVFAGEPFSQWSLAGTFFAPFFGPALAGAFVIQAWARPRAKELAGTAALGAVLAVLHAVIAEKLHVKVDLALHLTFGLGLASLLVVGANAARTRADERTAWLSILLPGAVLPLFVATSTFFLGLTALLHPLVYDASVYAADAIFGHEPSFVVARIFASAPYLAAVSRFVYWNLPLALAFVYGALLRNDPARSDRVLFSFVALGFFGFFVYHLYPVVGPAFFFGKDFPTSASSYPDPATGYLFPAPLFRNCMPSLHTGWALLVYWQSRPLGRAIRLAAFGWLLFTALGTLGFGFHYAMDLVVAVPFALAVNALGIARSALHEKAHERARRLAIVFGGVLTGAWLIALRWFPPEGRDGSSLRWLLALSTVASSFILERGLHVAKGHVPSARPARPPWARAELAVALVFFISGFSGLIYEVVFAKSLSLTFGSTATASTTVLATYMGGLSLGSWIGGEIGERRRDPLRVYALCEVAIAIYCAATPWLFALVRSLYVALAAGTDPGKPALVALQALLGALVLLPPTTLMGVTMPVLAKQFAGRGDLGRAIGLLYGANTLGAALGSWLTGYVVLSFLGVIGATWLAVLANLCVGLLALRLSTRIAFPGATSQALEPIAEGASQPASRSHVTMPLVVLGVGGFVTLALETTDVHLLAIVAGNSAYAFALMLFAFLGGLGLGAAAARRILRHGPATLLHLACIELALAATILACVHGWERIPAYFAAFAGFPMTRGFASREFVRFVVCLLMMIPPAFCIGTLFPMAMDLVTRDAENPVRATGRASALNTIGNITGAIVGGFFLIPRLGSLHALELLAALAFGLGLLPLFRMTNHDRRRVAAGALLVLGLFSLEPKSFDYDRLAVGSNVYFEASPRGTVIAHAESLDGGLTTVNEGFTAEGAYVLTLLTNGKFQGDTAAEMKAQYGYALYPLLHTAARDQALVIGLGTGVSAATVHRAGFRHVDIAELSRDIASLTGLYFSDVTGHILEQPGVDLHITDGRNFLMLTKTSYDLVTIEVTSIWFAGAGALYNREFYQLVKAHLRPEGVLQQWVQLHRIGVEDIVSILGTVRSEFAHVWLYFTGSQGVIVGCNHECMPTSDTLAAIQGAPELHASLGSIEGGAARLLGDRLLSPAGVDRFLADVAARGLATEQLVSTDDNSFLEYNTPRGNVRDYYASMRSNVALLRAYLPRSVLEWTRLREEDLAGALGGPETTREEPAGLTRDVRHGTTEP